MHRIRKIQRAHVVHGSYRDEILRFIFLLILIFIIAIAPLNKTKADEYLEGPVDINDFEIEDCSISLQQVPIIDAVAAIVMDAETGRVLFEKNAYSKRPIASTTKIMTGIIAIEMGNFDDEVTISKNASRIWGSVIDLQQDEKLTLEELLYGLMISSGNDAAIAIAEHIGGTLENFLEMMNKKARLIGARNTNFKSPHGLDIEGHYSTAYDLALITRYALGNPIFSKIVATKQVAIPRRNLYNTNEMLEMYQGANGVKTGYTGKAGRCLVTSATRDGKKLISVVLNCPSRYKRAESSRKILDYAFNNYTKYTLLEPGEIFGYLPVVKGMDISVPIGTVDKIVYPLTEEEFKRLEKKIWLYESFNAPVFAGIEAGYIKFMLDGKVIAESKLKTWNDIARKDFRYYLDEIIKHWLKLGS